MSNIGDGQMAPWHVMSSRSLSVDEEPYLPPPPAVPISAKLDATELQGLHMRRAVRPLYHQNLDIFLRRINHFSS
jgi:hypothetical protein